MKVLVIMGSPRKGNTYHAAEQVRERMQAKGDMEGEYLMLRNCDLSQCRGCFTCYVKGEEHCPIKDEAPAMEQKLQAADGVIFATSVYGMNISGFLKVFIDRFAFIFHRPRFFDKFTLLLTTSRALGIKEVLQHLDLVARVWGFDVAGRVGLVTPSTEAQLPPYRQRENEQKLKKAADAFHSALPRKTRAPSFPAGCDHLPRPAGVF